MGSLGVVAIRDSLRSRGITAAAPQGDHVIATAGGTKARFPEWRADLIDGRWRSNALSGGAGAATRVAAGATIAGIVPRIETADGTMAGGANAATELTTVAAPADAATA